MLTVTVCCPGAAYQPPRYQYQFSVCECPAPAVSTGENRVTPSMSYLIRYEALPGNPCVDQLAWTNTISPVSGAVTGWSLTLTSKALVSVMSGVSRASSSSSHSTADRQRGSEQDRRVCRLSQSRMRMGLLLHGVTCVNDMHHAFPCG